MRDRAGPVCGAVLVLAALCHFANPASAQDPAQKPSPVAVRDGIALVETENLIRLPLVGRQLVRLTFPDAVADGTAAPVLNEQQVGDAQTLLRRLYAAGRAAGNLGDVYDNRDRDHSSFWPKAAFPQLTRVIYGGTLRAAALDYGAALTLIFDAPLIGNSSTALTGGPHWRSQPRYMLTGAQDGPVRLFQNYMAGQIHVYPEHRDHDPEHGDLLPANTPYYLISQGSSGSDRAHLEALAMILAAFRPDTKAMLRETGLIAPTVQMVYRRARRGVLSREGYHSGLAHPTVFDAKDIVLGRMVSLANAISPETVPPMVRLSVVEESVDAEENAADDTLDERLFDTPSAIARVWRSPAWRRSMIVSADSTRDPNGRKLTFTWAVLRGDPAHTRVEPLTPDGSRARITVEWQAPRPVPGHTDILSSRVDIGVFVHNGVFDSAPAFISLLLPRHEERTYDTAPNAVKRLVKKRQALGQGAYVDPLIFPGARETTR